MTASSIWVSYSGSLVEARCPRLPTIASDRTGPLRCMIVLNVPVTHRPDECLELRIGTHLASGSRVRDQDHYYSVIFLRSNSQVQV